VLADPQRIISRVHARISFDGNRFILRDQSMNGVYLNGAQIPIGAGASVPLQDGDVFQLGHYQFKVSFAADTVIRKDNLPADLEPLDFLDEPLSAIAEEPSEPDWGVHELSRAGVKDPLDVLNIKSVLDNESLDAGWDKMAVRGETGSPLHQAVSIKSVIPENWDQDEAEAVAVTPDKPAVYGIKLTAEPMVPVVAPPPPAALNGAAHNELSANLSVFISDFLNQEGSTFTPQQIEQIVSQWGDVLKASVAGIMQALLARGAIKNELRITSTLVKPAENNPLKFSISVEDAVDKLFNRRTRGFMPPVEAVEDAFRDIAEHQSALLAASRAVSKRLMQQFAPEVIESRLKKRGVSKLKSLKAQLWDEYCAQMSEWTSEDSIAHKHAFNQEYAKAYEEAMQGMKKNK
ncbi:MAG TPA: type VI secretion system-associated FHA domain protein TagH, partial [Pseudomonadales bacterium]|nr:type VI secretion system-associated FHA domain protein TagH [Pseudomonadales bacterium]